MSKMTITSEPGANLSVLLQTWAEILRTGNMEALAGVMDEDVVWQGLRPELVCHGRDQAVSNMRSSAAPVRRITRIEAEEVGEHVVVSVESATFPEGPAGPELSPAGGGRSLVFTFRDGKVVRMESFPSRELASIAARSPVS